MLFRLNDLVHNVHTEKLQMLLADQQNWNHCSLSSTRHLLVSCEERIFRFFFSEFKYYLRMQLWQKIMSAGKDTVHLMSLKNQVKSQFIMQQIIGATSKFASVSLMT